MHAGNETIVHYVQNTLGRTMRVVWFGRSGRDTTPPMSALLLVVHSVSQPIVHFMVEFRVATELVMSTHP